MNLSNSGGTNTSTTKLVGRDKLQGQTVYLYIHGYNFIYLAVNQRKPTQPWQTVSVIGNRLTVVTLRQISPAIALYEGKSYNITDSFPDIILPLGLWLYIEWLLHSVSMSIFLRPE